MKTKKKEKKPMPAPKPLPVTDDKFVGDGNTFRFLPKKDKK